MIEMYLKNSYQKGLWWSGKYSFIFDQEVSGSIPLGCRVAFVREFRTPQCGVSWREFVFGWVPMWVSKNG